jgi:hypothetical protein
MHLRQQTKPIKNNKNHVLTKISLCYVGSAPPDMFQPLCRFAEAPRAILVRGNHAAADAAGNEWT